MESSAGGSAAVDFGRFCTGFLVVMGIGGSSIFFLPVELLGMGIVILCSREKGRRW